MEMFLFRSYAILVSAHGNRAHFLSCTMSETDTSTRIGRHPPGAHIPQDFRLVWVNDSFNESDGECKKILQQLCTEVNSVEVFTNSNACIDFLRDVSQDIVFVVVSAFLARDLVPQIHSMPQVSNIYISCSNPESDNAWTEEWPKIKVVCTTTESICKALQKSIRPYNHESTPMSFVPSDVCIYAANLDQLEPSFMYTQLFKGILLEMEPGENARKDMVVYYREQKKTQPPELRMIDEFDRDYRPDKAIWWYTRECFIYGMLNHALRLLESDIIVDMGFFIHDLHQQIEQLHREQFGQYDGEVFRVFRGQGLSTADFEKLEKIQGGLLSFNSFVSASTAPDMPKFRAESSSQAADEVGILFVMTIDPTLLSTPFANVVEQSYFGDEDEILFSMHSVFRVEQVKSLDSGDRLFEVRLRLTTDDDPQLRLLRDWMVEEVASLTIWDRLGHLLIKVRQLDRAEELYSRLISQNESEAKKARYNHQLGYIKDDQGDRKSALSYYETCLATEQGSLPANHPDLARSYNNIGSVYADLGEYSQALFYHEKCLDIQQQQKSLPTNHPTLAASYNNIASVHHNMGEYSKALSYYEKCRDIQQQSLPANHPDLASLYNK